MFNELEDGNHPDKQEKIVLLKEFNLLAINDEIEEIVEVHIANFLMPKDKLGDAPSFGHYHILQDGLSSYMELQTPFE